MTLMIGTDKVLVGNIRSLGFERYLGKVVGRQLSKATQAVRIGSTVEFEERHVFSCS